MVIGDYSGYSGYRQGVSPHPQSVYSLSVHPQRAASQVRPAVTLEAERDPHLPHQYRVAAKPQVIPPAEATSDAKSSNKKFPQNDDPVSRAFLAVANYRPREHSIDIHV